jgi:hypothetical protein
VDGRVGGVVELLEDVAVGRLGQNLVGFGDGALHAVGTRGEDDFGAEGKQGDTALKAHGFRHGEDELVALDCGDEGQGDAGVAAGGFNEHGLAGRDLAGLFGGVDHRKANAVFHARYGVLASSLATMVPGRPAETRLSRTSGCGR